MILLAALARRLLVVAPILLVVSLLLFIALRVLPTDPATMSMPPTATTDEIIQQTEKLLKPQPPMPQRASVSQGLAAALR